MILYSCPDVKKIYLLLRSKRGVSVSDRLAQLKSREIFIRIRQKNKDLLEKSARELCLIAENLKNLKVLAHISTTYCNPKYSVIPRVYPPLADWRQAIKFAENIDPDVLDILAPKYMNFQSNTYTFTKSLAEQIMNEYSRKLPIFIFRPSIVTPAVKEPLVGWVDNFNGLTGLLVSAGTGLVRVSYASPKVRSNFQPLDVVTRSLLVAIWTQHL
ncbi:Fatty acyl-CoA reductase [Sergentomyia squamirostris]